MNIILTMLFVVKRQNVLEFRIVGIFVISLTKCTKQCYEFLLKKIGLLVLTFCNLLFFRQLKHRPVGQL